VAEIRLQLGGYPVLLLMGLRFCFGNEILFTQADVVPEQVDNGLHAAVYAVQHPGHQQPCHSAVNHLFTWHAWLQLYGKVWLGMVWAP